MTCILDFILLFELILLELVLFELFSFEIFFVITILLLQEASE